MIILAILFPGIYFNFVNVILYIHFEEISYNHQDCIY